MGQYIPGYSIDSAGSTSCSATPDGPATKATALPSNPMLVYNCHTAPALCADVDSTGRMGAAVGNYPAPRFEAFGWDSDAMQKEARRRANYTTGWRTKSLPKGNQRCPESNQPPIYPLGTTQGYPLEVDLDTGEIEIPDLTPNNPSRSP